jgi:hypothetical protein
MYSNTIFRNILAGLSLLILALAGCREPTDLGGNVVEIPQPAPPVQRQDIRVTGISGGGRYGRFAQNGKVEPMPWTLRNLSIDSISIDTSAAGRIILNLRGSGLMVPDQTVQAPQALPQNLRFRIDSLIIPVRQQDSALPGPLRGIFAKDADMTVQVYNRKKDGQIDQDEKKFSLNDDNNFFRMQIAAVRLRPNPQPKNRMELLIGANFILTDIEVQIENRKDVLAINGELSLRINW